ncbi:MAG: D-alanyl-D-alanine carboxypeptidase [Thermoplasmataceae archaeon]|jgi:D-alanyl-D-alanine carboxypeptidase/D-alanyl-D-alanine-endopeptidase (penicillin-binding protein 4)
MKSDNVLAYCFTDMKGSVIESRLENTPMTPASNTKVITAYLAVEKYGMNHAFETSFGNYGNSILVNGGPTFFLNPDHPEFKKRFKIMIEQMRSGNSLQSILLSNPVVDNHRYNGCWQIGDSRYSYQAPISNFFVMENCRYNNKNNQHQGFSSIMDHVSEEAYSPVRNPDRYFADSLLTGFNMDRDVPVNKHNVKGTDISVLHSASLQDVATHMLVESCNFYAEILFKSLSYDGKNPGNWQKSAKLAVEMLSNIEGSEGIRIRDGSGLCKDNLLTPIFTVNLLRHAFEKYGEPFRNLFPSPGKGTLRKRLINYAEQGIMAKTGTLSSVSALSGYIASTGTIFSIFINNSLAQTKEREDSIDKIISNFIERHRNAA